MLVLLAAGVVLLVGFAAGVRFKEINLRMRELRLAQGRRELRQTAMAIQTHRELDWSTVPAGAVVHRALTPDGELLVLADTRIALEGDRIARERDRVALEGERTALEGDRSGAPEGSAA
ncbi:MAG TPA: hypothetical protein VH008_32520 [Pseudonocardia sp.]|nr:hypothetical protein [Pseudonocardia sp.]